MKVRQNCGDCAYLTGHLAELGNWEIAGDYAPAEARVVLILQVHEKGTDLGFVRGICATVIRQNRLLYLFRTGKNELAR